MPALPASGNIWAADARRTTAAGQVRQPMNVEHRQRRRGARRRPRTSCRRRTPYPYNGHLPIGPSCCVADVTQRRRPDLLELPEHLLAPLERRGGARHHAEPGARHLLRGLERLRQRAVRRLPPRRRRSCRSSPARRCALQFMRWDEHGWDNYGPPQLTDVRGGVDAKGNLVATEHDDLHASRGTRRSRPRRMLGLPAAVLDARPTSTRRTTARSTTCKNRRVIGKSLPLAEQLLQDDLAAGAGGAADDLRVRADDRRARLRGEDGPVPVPAPEHRHAGVRPGERRHRPHLGPLEERARRGPPQLANWQPRVAGRRSSARATSSPAAASRSARFAGTPVANIAEITVNKKTGKITPMHFYCAQDTGLTVYPDGVREPGGRQPRPGREPRPVRGRSRSTSSR